MSEYRLCCVFLMATLLTGLPSGGTETIFKSICLEDSVQLFQNVSLTNRTIVISQMYGGAIRQIAKWFMQDSILHSSIDKRYERIVSLDEYGTIWMRNVQHSDEGRYTLVSTEDTGSMHVLDVLDVELVVLVAPSMHCKPIIKLADAHLFAFLTDNDCGTPAASVYWLGYNNQTVIPLLPGKEAGGYHACIESPSLRCARRSKGTDYCSSFRTDTDERLIPKISLVQCNIADGSIVLQCQSNDKSAGRFRWRLNGIPINNNAKYFQMDDSLSIRHVKTDDQYGIYTCMESGGRFESDPYSIETSGPTSIKVKQNIMMVKEQDKLNVSCLTDCYPLCSVEWSKLDPSSGQKNVFLKDGALQITNITRKMSGNYSCKVQNLISGAFLESSLSLDVLYGPDDILLNTSNNIIEVDEFDSITILCTTECFPSCLITWTETSTTNVIRDAELKLVNVSTNGTYTCHAWNPKIDTAKISDTINITVKFDETLIPRIAIVRHNVLDSSVVLQCSSSRRSKGKFSWMINGSLIKNSDRYSTDNVFLYVRHLTAKDQLYSYTCREPGSKLQSDPFWIKPSGPTSIKVNPKHVVVKEHTRLNVSCLTDCYPLCSLQWLKLDPFSGQNNVFSEEHALQITDITREMSGNYSCRVQNIITGAFIESSLSLDVLYGPDDILFNTSNNITEVDEFDSITIICTAECFPSCMITWTETDTEEIILRGSNLKLVNVKMDGTYICHATNPKIANATISKTIIIQVKFDATLIPRIAIVRYNSSDSSIVLQCLSSRVSTGRFSWRVNGSVINNRGRYFEDKSFLFVRHFTADDQYNSYTCTEPKSGFQSDPFPTKTYGPDEVVLNTSKNTTEVYQFSSITVFCSADCFPPCLFRWKFSYTDTIIEGAELKLVNVTSNGSLTCDATNPINMNVTVSETIDIMVKSEDIHHTTSSVDTDQDKEATTTDIPIMPYLVHVIPGIGAFGLIVGVGFCFLKKYIHCPRVARASNNDISARPDIGESLQVETLSQHYWTIVTNARGEFSTALERDINVELREFVDPTYSDPMEPDESITPRHENPKEQEAYSHPFNSDPIETETSCSYSVECEGYISPIPSDPMKFNEYIDPIPLDPVELNEYIHPIPSDPVDLDGYTDPTPAVSKGHNRSIESIPSHPEESE